MRQTSSSHVQNASFSPGSVRPWMIGVAAVVLLVLLAWLYLNIWLTDYVNKVLNNIEGYQGSVESIDIALYRGAYRIHQLELYKKTGGAPVPFIAITTTDLSIEWGALLRGRIVSDVDLVQPVLNFTSGQTGLGIDWMEPIKDLMPIDINLVTFREGKLTYQDFTTQPKVNLYIHHMSGKMRNLRNVVDEEKALPSTLLVQGDSIGGGKLNIQGRMNILQPVPDMEMNAKLENVHLPALSNYSSAYAAIDIEEGDLDIYSEFSVKDNNVSGYIKPIATHIALIDLSEGNPVKLAWETIVATVLQIFTNQPRDQFATRIPLEGSLDNVGADFWSTLIGIFRNAFINAFERGLESDNISALPLQQG